MLRVGDKVKVKSPDEIAYVEKTKNITGPGWTPGCMEEYCGQKAKVISKYSYSNNDWVYLDIDDCRWVWDGKWLDNMTHHVDIIMPDEMFEI